MYRQGDVLLIPAARLPEGDRTLVAEGERVVLAEGEATGHAHAVVRRYPPQDEDHARPPERTADRPVALLEAVSGLEDRILTVLAEAALVHEEHGSIDLATGTYLVRRQREYTPVAPRRVAD